jgi:flagellar hook protein FlgE
VSGGGTLDFSGTGALVSTYTDPTITFDPATGALTGQAITLDFGTAGLYDGITQLSSPVSLSTTISQTQDGYGSGSLETFLIDDRGVITGIFTNGIQRALAQIALASFNNPRGLLKQGNSLYLSSRNSGTATPGAAGEGGRGMISPSSLEMSNVDLARQFTDMIVVERGFQANSRIITTGDEMLQEVINLKR